MLSRLTPLCLAALATLALPAAAEDTAPAPTAPGSIVSTAEPNVQRIVVEDDNARVDELRVRGVTRRITVHPKGPVKQGYEILPADAGRGPPNTVDPTGAAGGQRVWSVLDF